GGLALPAVTTLAMSDVPSTEVGLASGLANTTQQVGGALGTAALATAATTRTDSLRAAGQGAAGALTGGYHLAFGTAAGIVAVAVLIAATVLPPSRTVNQSVRPAPAHRG